MTLASTKLIPELQYYFHSFVVNSTMNKRMFPIPAPLKIEYLNSNKSFIRLLFDNTWDEDEYWYKYELVTRETWPLYVQTRLSVYPTSGQYYISSNNVDSTNLFALSSDDLMLLDELLLYRLFGDSTSFNIIDFSSLSTNLSKLIYIYLDLMINNNYSLYDSTTLISDPSFILECCYEAYVSEAVFNHASALNVELE